MNLYFHLNLSRSINWKCNKDIRTCAIPQSIYCKKITDRLHVCIEKLRYGEGNGASAVVSDAITSDTNLQAKLPTCLHTRDCQIRSNCDKVKTINNNYVINTSDDN